MADLHPTSDSSGLYFPQDFTLLGLELLCADGKVIELKEIMTEFSFYEDIYSPTISGYVRVADSRGFSEILPITGNEYLTLKFIKSKSDSIDPTLGTKIKFRVYKVDDRVPLPNMTSEEYSIYFCSEELLLSEQYKICKSYSAEKISTIIEDILTNKLNIPSDRIFVEETKGQYDFVIPNLKPFEAINWLSNYAQSKNNYGSDMLFYQSTNNFIFASLQTLFDADPQTTYRYQAKNLDHKIQDFENKALTILQYEYMKTPDVLNEIRSGAFANRLISINPLIRKHFVTDFSYDKYRNKLGGTSLLENGIASNLKNRLGNIPTETYQAKLKVSTSNFGYSSVDYIKDKPGSVENNVDIETYVTSRTAQLSLINYTRLKLEVPGDPFVQVGITINVNILDLTPTGQGGPYERKLNDFYSGKYLITAVRHIIEAKGRYRTILEVSKDSLKAKLPSFDNSNPNIMRGIK